MPILHLKPGREKSVLNRHPWIFSGAIARVEDAPRPGGIVDVRSATGSFLGRGYYNPRSQIAVRLLTWEDEPITAAWWRSMLERTLARRAALHLAGEGAAYRLVFAESDGLPGLIVDRYADWLVLQSLTLGIESWKATIAEQLMELTSPRGIYERSDVDVRGHEGLRAATGPLLGEAPPDRLEIHEHALRFVVDVTRGHKTGFYLDQRINRQRLLAYSAGTEMLNVFAYTGGFGVYAAAAGARAVTNLDSSGEALRAGMDNLALNGFQGDAYGSLEGDAFQLLRRLRDEGRRYDLIVLDPPKFAFSRQQLMAATRGYKDINLLALQLLRAGGILATFSCSGLVSEDLFQKVLFGASVDAQRRVQILERLGQSPDHPVLLTFPEGAYLKGFICRVE